MTSMLSLREASRRFAVSRATLTKALQDGTVSGTRNDAGHWRIDAAEMARVYPPRTLQKAVSRTRPDHVSHVEPDQKATQDEDMAVRLARAEAALDAEREKVEMLQRNLDDVRRMLPAPESRPRRRWWPW